jgi:FkbM family methyltransferase
MINQKYFTLADKPVIFDIGANIGHMTLNYVKMFPGSMVYAFEPTDYAFNKIQKNISLNPELSKRIILTKAFVSNKSENNAPIKAFASWKIIPDHSIESITHPVHSGIVMEATQTPSIRLDDYIIQNNIQKIDFIKIDTDGNELEVLQGGMDCICRFKPAIIIEVGLYILKEKGIEFEQFFDLFEKHSCDFINTKSGHKITRKNYTQGFPAESTLDILILFA